VAVATRTLTVPLAAGPPVGAIVYAAEGAARSTFVMAHGAGAGQRSPFMTGFARALAGLGLDVVTFNFPYTEQGRRVPDRAPVLEACYEAVVNAARLEVRAGGRLVIGGKSMGGRIASQLAAARPTLPIAGLVFLGYPLHPPGRPEARRDAHLGSITRPMLFVQGERDAFGTPAELAPLVARLTPSPDLHVVAGGDHSFKVPRAGGAAQDAVYAAVQRAIAEWIARLA
jgi:hypothetical protein